MWCKRRSIIWKELRVNVGDSPLKVVWCILPGGGERRIYNISQSMDECTLKMTVQNHSRIHDWADLPGYYFPSFTRMSLRAEAIPIPISQPTLELSVGASGLWSECMDQKMTLVCCNLGCY